MSTLQAELRGFLNSKSATTDSRLGSRNVEIVMHLYGFGGSPSPTQGETATHFGLKKKQNVQQIQVKYLPDQNAFQHVPSLRDVVKVVEERPFWLNSDLTARLHDAGLVDDGFSPVRLPKLAADTGLSLAYQPIAYRTLVRGRTLSAELGKIPGRTTKQISNDYFTIGSQYLPRARALLKSARSFHNKYGLARISDLQSTQGQGADTEDCAFLEQLLRVAPDGWTTSEGDELWYCFETTKQNAIRNTVAKVLTALDYGDAGNSCDAGELARVCLRDLSERKGTKEYPDASPPESLVYHYLTSSPTFALRDGQVQFVESRNGKLNGIDRDLVDHLKTRPNGSTRPDVREHLEEHEHEDDYIEQTLQYSPLIRVDERKGRGDFRYFLTGTQRDESTLDSEAWERRYAHYKEELQALRKTDVQSNSMSRAEQRLLREWLFEGKEELDCALCGRRYLLPDPSRGA